MSAPAAVREGGLAALADAPAAGESGDPPGIGPAVARERFRSPAPPGRDAHPLNPHRDTGALGVDTALSTRAGAVPEVEVPAQRQRPALVSVREPDTQVSTGPDRGTGPVRPPRRDERGDRGAAATVRVADEDRSPDASASRQVRQIPHQSREERFTQLYRAHAPRVGRVIAAAVRPQDRTNVMDDLAQETFLKTWVSLDKLDQGDDDAAGRYITAIARNTVRSHYREVARRRREVAAGHDAPVWGSSAVAAAAEDTAAEVDEFDVHLAVIKALNDGLPDEVAQVLRLRFFADQPIIDVAERIGRSRATTVRRQAEGLALLRDRLAADRAAAGDESGVVRSPDVLKRARRAVARAEQQRAAAAQRAADRAMLPAARPEVTLRDYGATRLVPAMRGLAERKPAEQYRAGWRQRVLPALGDRPVRAIDTHAVQQAVQSWTAGEHSRATIMATRSVLARVLDEAVADGLLQRNPAREPAREPARDDLRQVGQLDPPAPQPDLVKVGRHAAASHDDTARSDRHDGRPPGAGNLAAESGPTPAADPAPPSAADVADRDPLAGARQAVARVGQLRATAQRRTEERARAEQLARWHADDQSAQDGDGRGFEAVTAVRDSGAGLGGQS